MLGIVGDLWSVCKHPWCLNRMSSLLTSILGNVLDLKIWIHSKTENEKAVSWQNHFKPFTWNNKVVNTFMLLAMFEIYIAHFIVPYVSFMWKEHTNYCISCVFWFTLTSFYMKCMFNFFYSTKLLKSNAQGIKSVFPRTFHLKKLYLKFLWDKNTEHNPLILNGIIFNFTSNRR